MHNQIESKEEKFGDPNANVVSKLYNLKKLHCILYWDFDSKFFFVEISVVLTCKVADVVDHFTYMVDAPMQVIIPLHY